MPLLKNRWPFIAINITLDQTTITSGVLLLATMAAFYYTRDSLAICLILLAPLALLAWASNWFAGAMLGLAAAALTAPYGRGDSLIAPAYDFHIWVQLAVAYLLLGLLMGYHGFTTRKQHAQSISDIHKKLEKAQASTKYYETLLAQAQSNQRLHDRMNTELALLNAIAVTVNGTLDLAQVQADAAMHLRTMFELDELCFFWLHPDGSCLKMQEAGCDATLMSYPVTGIIARVIAGMHACAFTNDSRLARDYPPGMSRGMQSVSAVPLRSQGQLVGVMVLGRTKPLPFSEEDLQFLESVGRILAIAMENARLYMLAQELSLSDDLTGLGNRRMLHHRLNAEIARMKIDTETTFCLTLIDLDHFKTVNDRHGHAVGDEVLRIFAQRVANEIRGNDLFCRVGGEEFALVTFNNSLSATKAIVERLCRKIAQTPFRLENDITLTQTFSAGVVLAVAQQTPDELLKDADSALYAAKASGRNRVNVSTAEGTTNPETICLAQLNSA